MRCSRCGKLDVTAVPNRIERADQITRATPRANNRAGNDHAYRNGCQLKGSILKIDETFLLSPRYRNRKPP
jgi:hypothetical protein